MRSFPRWLPLFLLSCAAFAQSSSPCRVSFAVVAKDELNNVRQGFAPKTLAWFEKKMAKKYPDVCYSTAAPPVVLFFSSRPDVYHGTRTVTNSGTVTDRTVGSDTYGQQIATTDSDQQVPYEVEYDRLYLSVEQQQADGTWKVMHNFSGKSLHPTMYGICTHNCHPNYKNIENALKWLQDGGLTDPSQSVLP